MNGKNLISPLLCGILVITFGTSETVFGVVMLQNAQFRLAEQQ